MRMFIWYLLDSLEIELRIWIWAQQQEDGKKLETYFSRKRNLTSSGEELLRGCRAMHVPEDLEGKSKYVGPVNKA